MTTEFGDLANEAHNVERFLAQIDALLELPSTIRMRVVLDGIRATIVRTNRVSRAQEDAIKNIAVVSVRQELDADDAGRVPTTSSRRYEGFRSGRRDD